MEYVGKQEDFYWLNEDSRTFLSRGYIQGDTPAEERIREIARAAQKYLYKNPGFEDRFYHYMARGWVSLASPVWANFGTNRGLPISCNGSYVEDTMQDIILKTAEIGMQTKMGAGTSAYFGDVRARGSAISTGGTTHGPVHFLSMVETFTNVISQSNVRRGSCAVYLNVEHPDIEEFLECREEGNEIQHLSLGVCIGDEWMQSMIDGDKDKQKIWRRILRKRFESGYPYLFFTDTVNNNAPQVYKDKNRKIYASNLCLKANTIVEVLFAYNKEAVKMDIETFTKLWNMGTIPPGTCVKSLNGFKAVTGAAKTGTSKEMIRITDEDTGKTVECTPEHLIFTKNRGWIQAQNLQEDDVLHIE
jgi:ribonucleotide reductase alpha subunit